MAVTRYSTLLALPLPIGLGRWYSDRHLPVASTGIGRLGPNDGEGRSDWRYMNVGVGRCKLFEIVAVARHHHAAACLDGRCNAMGVHESARIRPRRRNNAADETSEVSICFTNFETRLTAETSIDHLIQSRPPIQLCQDHGGNQDFAS